jgi:hypothetical protein
MIPDEIPDVGVNFTEQAPFDSTHVFGEITPAPVLDHVTLPVGVESPVTVALQVVGVPTTKVEEVHETEEGPLTVSCACAHGLIAPLSFGSPP